MSNINASEAIREDHVFTHHQHTHTLFRVMFPTPLRLLWGGVHIRLNLMWPKVKIF